MHSDSESPLLTYLLTNEPSFRKARLGALYSDFRQLQSTNPDGYAANIEAWHKALAHACRAGVLPSHDLLTLSIDESLLRSLENKEWGRPIALGTVVQESVKRKEMLGIKEFEGARESIYTKRWDLSPLSVLGWGLRQLGLFQGGNKLPVGRLVVLENLEEAGRELQSRVGGKRGRVDRIYSRRAFEEEFRDVLGETKLSGHDFDVLLRFLERDKEVLVYDKDTVKLRAAGEEKMITQEDATISSLKTLITDLEAQTHVLEKRVEALGEQAKEAVERKNRVSALAALKSKKLAETSLGKRYATLSQLEEVFVKIEQAADQVELVRVMEGSTKVLAGLNKQIGGVERVDDIVEQLREQMGQVNEVGDVLAEPGKEGVDESEVDDELEAMERAEKEKQEEAERKAKEETERREAEETRKKLAELEEVKRQAAKDRAAADQKSVEPQKEETCQAEKLNADLNKSMEDLRRIHLEPAQEAA